MKKAIVFAMCVAAFVFAGCEKYREPKEEPPTLTGKWSGSGHYDRGVAIHRMELDLTQGGNALAGTYEVDRAARYLMEGIVRGSVSGNSFSDDFTPHGKAEGTFSANKIEMRWYESGFAGVGGWGSVTLRRQ